MFKQDCFAFRTYTKRKEGITWEENKCDCLTDFFCDKCPFYKNASTLVRYEYKINQTPGVGYYERKNLSNEI